MGHVEVAQDGVEIGVQILDGAGVGMRESELEECIVKQILGALCVPLFKLNGERAQTLIALVEQLLRGGRHQERLSHVLSKHDEEQVKL